jgi:hypothetical protein
MGLTERQGGLRYMQDKEFRAGQVMHRVSRDDDQVARMAEQLIISKTAAAFARQAQAEFPAFVLVRS